MMRSPPTSPRSTSRPTSPRVREIEALEAEVDELLSSAAAGKRRSQLTLETWRREVSNEVATSRRSREAEVQRVRSSGAAEAERLRSVVDEVRAELCSLREAHARAVIRAEAAEERLEKDESEVRKKLAACEASLSAQTDEIDDLVKASVAKAVAESVESERRKYREARKAWSDRAAGLLAELRKEKGRREATEAERQVEVEATQRANRDAARSLREAVDVLEAANRELRERMLRAETEADEARSQLDAARQSDAATRCALTNAKAELAEAVAKAEHQGEELRARIGQVDDDKRRAQARATELERRLADADEAASLRIHDLEAAAQAAAASFADEIRGLRADHEGRHATVRNLEATAAAADKRAATLQHQLDAAIRARDDANRQNDHLESKLADETKRANAFLLRQRDLDDRELDLQRKEKDLGRRSPERNSTPKRPWLGLDDADVTPLGYSELPIHPRDAVETTPPRPRRRAFLTAARQGSRHDGGSPADPPNPENL